MINRKVIVAGLAAGVLYHILQGGAAYFIFDQFYLENPDIIRDSNPFVGYYYLGVNIIVGLVIAILACHLKNVFPDSDWKSGVRAAIFIWAGSSLVFTLKRQIILNLSSWLILEIVSDFFIYCLVGAVAGYLSGRGIVEKTKE
jgi:hypothetical protein